MKVRQRKKIIKNENSLIESFVTEKLMENMNLSLIESHSWKTDDNIFEIRYGVKNFEWWNLIVYIDRKEASLSFQLVFLPLDKLSVIKNEQKVEKCSIGKYEVSFETFKKIKAKVDSVIKDEYYYIALKYSGKKGLTISEAKTVYNEFVNEYNSLLLV